MATDVIELFERAEAYLRGHFLLTSGRHSDVYFEKFMLLQHPGIVSELCGRLAAPFKGKKIATVVGPALGGLIYLAGPWAPFAACLVASPLVAAAMLAIRARTAREGDLEGSAMTRVIRSPAVISATVGGPMYFRGSGAAALCACAVSATAGSTPRTIAFRRRNSVNMGMSGG